MKKVIYLIFFMTLILINSCGDAPKKDSKNDNPLLAAWDTPHQTPPFDKIKHEHYIPAFNAAIEESRVDIDAIANNPQEADFANTIEAFEHSGHKLGQVSSIFFNITSAETDSEMDKIEEEITPVLTDYSNDIYLNENLFARVKQVYDKKESLNLNGEQLRLLDKIYASFVRQGANLSAEDKEKFRNVSKELSLLSLKFGNNVLSETNAYTLQITDEKDLAGLPESIVEAAAFEAKNKNTEGWVFTLQQPSYGPFLKYADKRKLREELYRAYNSKSCKGNEYDNKENVRKLVNLRLEMAQLLGSPTYADYALKTKMAENPQAVNNLLNQLLVTSKPVAVKEIDDLQKFAQSQGADFKLMPWDFSYYSEKLKTQKYAVDDEVTRPYFQLDKVIDGIFQLSNRLYGLKFTENKEIPVYHADVKTYEVTDESGKLISILYLDFFPREGKRGGAWMTEYRTQYKQNGADYRPFVSLVCNFTKPTADKPSLLTFYETETFLHEFGHGLHSMLSDVTYESLAGTNVLHDFVELPSQIMENWGMEKEFLDMFATHYQTGEKIPAELIQRIIDSRNFMEGYASVRQLMYGTLDIAYHSIDKPLTENIAAFEMKAVEPMQILPVVDGTLTSTAFSHIFAGGYSAGYYGYKWAEVLDADAFSVFKKNGIFDKATADSFRNNILSKGDTEKPMILYVRFRGQEPTIDALLRRSGFIK
ncbi:MAG: M3 family metallopeptidase [Prevotellaceae bacterium]|jgi:peptidyl-dipeptidase Dcp|nr:M3 family metallopeptidase [Prevotellaceae bacterium]